MATMKLPRCDKCRGKLHAQKVVNSLIFVLEIYCLNCGWRMQSDDVERLVRGGQGVMRITSEPKSEVIPPKKEAAVSKNKKKVCLECGEFKTMIGRGLCCVCYARFRDCGELDTRYPKMVRQKSKHQTKRCLECDRLMMIIGRGLCSRCLNSFSNDGTLDDKYPLTGKRLANKKALSATPEEIKQPPVEVSELPVIADTVITVEFGARDQTRFVDICAAAEHNRRSPSEEILFRLDRVEDAS